MKVESVKKVKSIFQIHFMSEESAKAIPDFTGKKNEVAVRYDGKTTIIYCGVGPVDKCIASAVRSVAAKATRLAGDKKYKEVSLILSTLPQSRKELEVAALQGALAGAYNFGKFKSEKPVVVDSIELVGTTLDAAEIKRIQTISVCVNEARDLVNDNAHEIYPEILAQKARAIGRETAITVKVLSEKEIARLGMGLLSAVGQGSPNPPRLIIMEYKGDRSSKKRTAIIGKGITFDSGGQNLKPTGSIETMRCDMAGAAAVLGIMDALGTLKPKINVVGVVAAAHNAIDGTAYFPGDIYKSFLGKTVQIDSTDAEGRLVLADAIAYTIKQFKPTAVIDLATLTGGILIALGDFVAGLFSNDDSLANALYTTGEQVGERLWRFPIYEEYSEAMKGDLSDLRNVSKLKKSHAAAICGAAFLQEFVGTTSWAHIDIAGTAYNEGEARGEVPKFGTGFGVRLITGYLMGVAK